MRRVILISFAAVLFLSGFGSRVYADLVTDGRKLLFNQGNPTYSGVLSANQKFKDALAATPNNHEANLFYAITRMASFALKPGSGDGLETLKDLFEAFGMNRNSNNFLYEGLPYDTPSDLPENSPSPETVRQFLSGPYIILIDDILDDIARIPDSFKTMLSAQETGDRAVEVDYGDVLMYETLLNAKRCLFLIVSSYNFDMDIVAIAKKIRNDQFNINNDLLKPYPDLLKLLSSGESTLIKSETGLLETISSYLDASAFIRAETDNQLDDLITLDPENIGDEALFRQNLNELRTSLHQNKTANLTDNDKHLSLNLNPFFGYGNGPYNLRDFLPELNPCNEPVTGTMGHGLGNDPTLGGILPDFSQADWGFELSYCIIERVLNWAEFLLPELLPPQGRIIYGENGLYVRYYPSSGIYLGGYQGRLLYYHPALSPDVYDLGSLDEYLPFAVNAGF